MLSTAIETAYLAEQLKLLVENPQSVLIDDEHRKEIQRLTRQASIALETTQESMQRVMFSHLPLVTTYISNDVGIFATLIKADEVNPVSLNDLSKASGLDHTLVRTIMDYHCYHGAATEPRQGFYAPTRLTHSLSDPKVDKTTTCWHEVVGPAYAVFHSVLMKNGVEKNQKTAFQVAHKTSDSFYDFLESHPDKHKIFYDYMAANHSVTGKWIDVVRFNEEFAQGIKSERDVVFVDIGGGDGGQSIEVQKVHNLGGRIIMQDRPAVVNKAVLAREAGIETMEYDFFLEQPIKGARVYFIQFVLLNWQDDECVRILASQVPAMNSESVLMIVDFVQGHRWEHGGAPREPDLWTPSTAIAARACHNSKGRARSDYAELLGRAGLKLTEIRIFTDAGQAVIIAKKM
ncbi:hypothetical protein KCU67_g560, partial [Aureobasidium melanogenum]